MNTENKMTKKSKEDYIAINTRIPKEIYEQMQESLRVTKKTIGAYVGDSIVQYTQLITNTGNDVVETDSMQIDKFAWQLHRKTK
mgnify:CR=1 FL=1